MATTPGIPIGQAQNVLGIPGPLSTQTMIPGNQSPAASAAAAARAAQAGFATAAVTQLYPGADPGVPPPQVTTPRVVDWVDASMGGPAAGVNPRAINRGHPSPMSWWMRRWTRGPETQAQPVQVWLQSRPYDRGAGAYSPHFGTLPTNPIGAGIYSPFKLPVIAGAGGRYVWGAIWWNVQAVPTSMLLNPTIPVETMNALIATSSVGGTILTTG